MRDSRIDNIFNAGYKENKKYVLYWMQQSQRVEYNHALSYAIDEANKYNLPLLVLFVLNADFPSANLRHFTFMLQGIQEVKEKLIKLDINFTIQIGPIISTIQPFLNDAISLIMDLGYLRIQKHWREDIISEIQEKYHINTVIVESDLIVPYRVTSNKLLYSARIIRPLLHKYVDEYRDDFTISEINNKTYLNISNATTLDDINKLLIGLGVDKTVLPSKKYVGGYKKAKELLHNFISTQLPLYHLSNDPSTNYTSHLSMYLHFGQISSCEIINNVIDAANIYEIPQDNVDGFIEQILVRRELSFNYISYQQNYDEFEFCTDPWAYKTMEHHLYDEREYIYGIDDYESFQTHDIYFNAAMIEMIVTGFMHNYMRMYWAKKIIEWSASYTAAYEIIKYLNDKYFIDGRDANSYTGIAWVFGKHDRAWTERPIFGKLRYMNANGLKRKFDIELYVKQCNEL